MVNFLQQESSEIERREKPVPFLLLSLFYPFLSLSAAGEPPLFGRFFMLDAELLFSCLLSEVCERAPVTKTAQPFL